MKLIQLVTIGMMAAALGFIIVKLFLIKNKEGMGGYGILSGLYFNNNAKRCFKNPYDPEWFEGYCETIGTVVI